LDDSGHQVTMLYSVRMTNCVSLTRPTSISKSLTCNHPRKIGFGVAVLLCLLNGTAGTASAQALYNSIPAPLPSNVLSAGPEAYGFAELGDGIVLSTVYRTPGPVTVILSSFACTSGQWFIPIGSPGSCVTSPAGATFSQAITLNIYAVIAGAPPTTGPLLATVTQTFNIPYRPSSDLAHCGPAGTPGGDGEEWYSPVDNFCNHGIAFPISFDLSSLNLNLPDQVILTVGFNTTHYGPAPVGEGTTCFITGNCPYDSLNIGTFSTPSVGSDLDTDGIYVRYSTAGQGCTNSAPVGVLADDTSPGCWTGLHPGIEVDFGYNPLFFNWFFAESGGGGNRLP